MNQWSCIPWWVHQKANSLEYILSCQLYKIITIHTQIELIESVYIAIDTNLILENYVMYLYINWIL